MNARFARKTVPFIVVGVFLSMPQLLMPRQLISQPLQGVAETSRVLVIHSYHPSFDWTRNIHEGLINELDEWNGNFSLSVEYMDTKRILSAAHLDGLATLYQAKYHEAPPDLIICSDNNAFNLLYERRRSIFGVDVPVVFCGVNGFERGDYPGFSNIVGVEEKPDPDFSMSIIDQFHSGYPPVVFITDTSVTGKIYSDGFDEWVKTRDDAERFSLIENGFPNGILSQLSRLPQNAILYYLTYTQDPAGASYAPTDLLNKIVERIRLPIYGDYTWMFGEGIVGGPLIDDYLQGVLAARLAISILDGAIDPAVFHLEPCPMQLTFDYRFMKKANIFIGKLPIGADLQYQPDFFWRRFPMETSLLSVILALLIGGLVTTSKLVKQRGELLRGSGEINRRLKLNENRLETLVALTHLENQDDRELVARVLENAAGITASEYAVGVYRENGSSSLTEFLVHIDTGAEAAVVFSSPRGCIPEAPWLQAFHSRHVIQFNRSVDAFRIGDSEISFRRGILVPSGDLGESGGFSFVMGVFNKNTPYDEADERQLTLLTDGAWRILSRNKSEQAMKALNLSLETRVKERSEELHKAEAELIRTEKMVTLGSLVAGLAHEVNTPLGLAVTGGSYIKDMTEKIENLYRDETLDRESLEEFLSSVKDVSDSFMVNLRRAVELMQTFKQVAVDQTGETPRGFNVSDYIREILTTLQIPLRRANVSVKVDCSAEINLNHFPGDVGRVFTNLVFNSLIHGFENRDSGVITIAVHEKDGNVHGIYSDNGRGIPESELKKVFNPFFTTKRDSGGTGLGLHLVRSIICDRHGGTVDLKSRRGEGVEFTFSFPLVSPALKDFIL